MNRLEGIKNTRMIMELYRAEIPKTEGNREWFEVIGQVEMFLDMLRDIELEVVSMNGKKEAIEKVQKAVVETMKKMLEKNPDTDAYDVLYNTYRFLDNYDRNLEVLKEYEERRKDYGSR